MKSTTVVMFVASLWFIILGSLMHFNKSFQGKLENGVQNVNDKKGYIRFNSIYNIAVGLLGILVAIADYFVKEKSWVTLGVFVVIMFGASFVQSIMGKKYR